MLDAAVLRDAYEHPERYPALLVRVSGYCARFCDLADDVKLDIIARTEHASNG